MDTMVKIAVIDGQGGGIGAYIIKHIKWNYIPKHQLILIQVLVNSINGQEV